MVYSFKIDVEKGIAAGDERQFKLGIGKGVIDQWTVFFPRGSWAKLRFRVQKGSQLLFPANRDGYIAGDSNTLVFSEWILIDEPPYELDVYAHNLASDWLHLFILYVSINPLWTKYPFSREFKQLQDREINKLIF